MMIVEKACQASVGRLGAAAALAFAEPLTVRVEAAGATPALFAFSPAFAVRIEAAGATLAALALAVRTVGVETAFLVGLWLWGEDRQIRIGGAAYLPGGYYLLRVRVVYQVDQPSRETDADPCHHC